MLHIPQIKRLQSQNDLQHYADTYFDCSGLPVPTEYISSPGNRVCGVLIKKRMIGGFILGQGTSMRTLEVFAQTEARLKLYQSIGPVSDFTEITCFWMDPAYRKNTALNTFTWLALAFCLRRFGTPKILFGTCSSSLARLYGVTPKSELIHRDRINGKRTYIFQSERSVSVQGFLEILRFKLSRTVRIRKQKQARPVQQIS
jgi:hypothetical protein